MLDFKRDGGRNSSKTELKPITVFLEYGERWGRNKIDIVELVNLRKSGLTLSEISARLSIGKTTALRRLKRKGL